MIGVLLATGLSCAALLADSPTCLKCLTFQHQHPRFRAGTDRCASTSLKTLSSAQADFRANDRDGDGVPQFWRADVAGLYHVARAGSAIKLIDLSVAEADDRPQSLLARRAPKSGHWYRAIRHADEDPKKLDPNRFAFCCYPDTPEAGKYIFIVDENNTVYRSLADGRRGIDVYPAEEELKTRWNKLD